MPTPEHAARELAQLGRQLKAADRQIALDLRREMRAAAKPTLDDIRSYARAILPNRGGLADRVASQKFGLRIGMATKGGSVRIAGAGMKSLRDIDRGRLRHPVYGNRDRWAQQSVTPGFFTGPIEDDVPRIRDEIQRAMDKTAEKLVQGVGT